MEGLPLKALVKAVPDLHFTELKRLRAVVEECIDADQVGKALADRESQVANCPHCCSEEFIKYGTTKQGHQRFRCKSCLRTFSTLTGTPLARLKKREKWVAYSDGMFFAMKLRECARTLGVNLKTAWLWRHRFLTQPCTNKPTELAGIIEADEAFINESFKGKRVIDRAPRKRSGGKDAVKVPILLALDRNGSTTHHVLMKKSKAELSEVLVPLLTPNSVLCTDGNLSYSAIVKELPFEVDHKRLVGLDGERVINGIYHIQTLNGWTARWRGWLAQFYGVGTAYLDNYLAWFRQMLEMDERPDWVRLAL